MEKTGERRVALPSMALSLLIGSCVFLGAAMGFPLLFAAMISGGLLGQGIEQQLVISGCVAGGLAGGVITGHRWGRCRLPAGLATAVCGVLLLLCIRLLVFDVLRMDGGMLTILAGSLCGGALAGLLPSGKKKKKKRR